MKKNLLIAVAALFVAIGANAQKVLSKSSFANIKFDKTVATTASAFDGTHKTVKKSKVSRASAIGTIFGDRIATQLASDGETMCSFPLSLESANVQDEAGNTYNVKINDFYMEGLTCYGIYNEADGTLRIPNQIVWDKASLEELGYSEATATYGPLEIVNIDAEDKVSMEDIVFVEENGVFTFDPAKTSAYYIYADGADSGWDFAYDVTIAPYNGEISFSTTSTSFMTQQPKEGSNWGYGEMEINYEDWGSSVQINGFLGSGCINITYNGDGTATMEMGQRLSADKYPNEEGYMVLTGVLLDEAAGTISIDETGSVTGIVGNVYQDVEINGRPADVIMFYGLDDNNHYTFNEYFIPLTEKQGYWMGGWFCALDVVLYKDGTTSIKNVNTSKTNGTVKTYNLMGQEVTASTKGLVIRDGKKFINK